jgi:hypothetical protein
VLIILTPKTEPEKGSQMKKILSESQKASIIIAVSFLTGKQGYFRSITKEKQKQHVKKINRDKILVCVCAST